MSTKINVLSLFDGISCGMIALERAGFEVENYYSSEIDKQAISISTNNYPNIIRMGGVENWISWDIDWGKIDLLIGGSPCQGFSSSGKGLNFDDPRSKLFFEFSNILSHIKSLNPDVKFMLENVKMKEEWCDVITQYLGVRFVEINSRYFSAQNRVRYYWCNFSIPQYVDKGIILEDIISKKEFEVRFLGIDAPEINYCNKIKQDEKELQVPAALLIKLGYLSFNFLKDQVNLGDYCTLVQEQNNLVDKYGRHLGYLILNDGRVLNEIMIKEGYAKPYNDVFCEMLPLYQEWNLQAKNSLKGLYSLVNRF